MPNKALSNTDPDPKESFYMSSCLTSSWLLLALVIAMLSCLFILAWPSIQKFGLPFIWSTAWSPPTNEFGALPIILGTLITAVMAAIIAAPTAFCVAVLLTHITSPMISAIISRLIEFMAAIPSIIYGIWGLFILAPFLSEHIYIHIMNFASNIPVLNFIFKGIPVGTTLMTATLVLVLMIFPLICAMMRDVIASIPPLVVEASYGVGLTRAQIVWHIFLHYARAGLLGSVVLGLGRALGETMAVTFVIGNAHDMPQGMLMPGTTISATIANEFTEATTHLYQSALIELGLILFVISIIVLMISRNIMKHRVTRGGSQ
jgi:phosphate transport system permease protein